MFAVRTLPAAAWWRWSAVFLGIVIAALAYRYVYATLPLAEPYRVTRLEMATLAEPSILLANSATYAVLSDRFQAQGRYGAARIQFEVSDPATAKLALLLGRVRDNFELYINGKLAMPAKGQFGKLSTLHGFHPHIFQLLPSMLVRGKNTVVVLVSRNATRAVMRDVFLGPLEPLNQHYKRMHFLTHDNAEITALLAVAVFIVAISLASIVRNRALLFTIAVTLLLFTVRELHSLWIDQPWPQMWRDVFLNTIATWLWCACAAFTNEWTDGPPQLRRLFPVIAILGSIINVGAYYVVDCQDAYRVGSNVQAVCGMTSIVFMFFRISRHYSTAPASAWGEILLATIGLSMAIATVTQQSILFVGIGPSNGTLSEAFNQFAAISIILFLALGLARYGNGVYQLAMLNNETLAQSVEQKERELLAQHEIIRAREAEQTLVRERGRIMSDVHDGIGSQLLGLLLQAKSGKASDANLVDGLQSALDDLYLVVESLDSVEGSLETALGSFRSRIEPRCLAAGAKLEWNIETDPPLQFKSPTAVLQICRILQEAVSNALRHGKASKLSLRLAGNPNGATLVFADNGSGFQSNASVGAGRGLPNMRKRAAVIGAEFSISSTPSGTTITLTIPKASMQPT